MTAGEADSPLSSEGAPAEGTAPATEEPELLPLEPATGETLPLEPGTGEQ